MKSPYSLMLLLLLPIVSFAQLKDENLLVAIPSGYKIAFQTKKDNMIMSEMVPQAETVDNWTEMVTTQIFLDKKDSTPQQFQDIMSKSWAGACKDSTTVPVTDGKENGYVFSIWQQTCPHNETTGKPENTWFKAIKGNDSFYVVQKAFKSEPTDEQIVQWMKYFRTVLVCDTRSKKHPCPKTDK